jgi:hypothetical protein
MKVIKFVTAIVKLAMLLLVAGVMFSCVAAVVKAPTTTASSYRPGVSCSMLQSKDGSGYRTTMDCN